MTLSGHSVDCAIQKWRTENQGLPYTSLNDGAASEMTEGEVCPDNEKSGSVWPSKLETSFWLYRSSRGFGIQTATDVGDVQSDWSGHLANAGEVLISRRLIIETREDISNV